MTYLSIPYSGPSKIHYLFVDAGSLRGKIDNFRDKFFAGQPYQIDFAKLAQGLPRFFITTPCLYGIMVRMRPPTT